MELINQICTVILAITGALLFYKTVYQVLGLFVRATTYPQTVKRGKYAVVIAARNEEAVIPKLIDSIRNQDYDGPEVEIFVVADNCTDRTADVCRAKGAIVYERFDKLRARKGYALEYLFSAIERDYGTEHVDGYFVFDADNLLAPDFISRMNEAFLSGHNIVTGYRNTKNFDTNYISAAYGIHFYRNSVSLHRPRSFLGVGTHLTGTGYLIASELLIDGWHYSSFTEDDQLSMEFSAKGHKIAYCEAAQFFDEQPVDMRTVYNQRVRWAKGRLLNFYNHSTTCLRGIFKRRSFTCYDMFCHYFPYGLFSLIIGGIYPLLTFVMGLIQGQTPNYGHMAWNMLLYFGSQYAFGFISGLLTVLKEYRHIRCRLPELALYLIVFPWFDLISIPVTLVALVKKVEWAPILHTDARSIHELYDA